MSTTFKATGGETLDTVSRRCYGHPDGVDIIRGANPGVTEPLVAGVTLNVPEDPTAPIDKPAQVRSPEVAIRINGVNIEGWQRTRITRSLDSMSTFTLLAPFSDAVEPFGYESAKILIDGAQVFAGTVVGVLPKVDANSRQFEVNGYSSPGVIVDCPASVSSYPIEFKEMTLAAIADQICRPFGLKVIAEADTGTAFKKVALPAQERVLAFLARLAEQRGLVLRDNENGALVITEPATDGRPVATLAQGAPPLLSAKATFNSQEYYSSITGLESRRYGEAATPYTFRNPFLTGATRPFTFEVTDAEKADIKKAVATKAARMFSSSASYTATIAGWTKPDGGLWTPGEFVTLQSENAFVNRPTKFAIREVILEAQPDRKTTVLNLILPGTLSGQIPESVPWA